MPILLNLIYRFNAILIIILLLLLLLLSRFSCVRLCATPWRQPIRLPRPWDSPGKNTGVGCHFLLQRMKVKSQSEVAVPCLTLSDPMDCSIPGSSIHGIFQARVLEWGAIDLRIIILARHFMDINKMILKFMGRFKRYRIIFKILKRRSWRTDNTTLRINLLLLFSC